MFKKVLIQSKNILDLDLDRILGRGISLCPIAYLLHFGTMPKISFVRSFTSFNENSTANTQLAYDFLLHRRKLMMSIYHELRALYNFHSTSRVFPLQTIARFTFQQNILKRLELTRLKGLVGPALLM